MNSDSEIQEILKQFTTIGDFLRWTMSHFEKAQLWYGHGSDNAYDEALYLVAFALHLKSQAVLDYRQAKITQQEKQAIIALVGSRIEKRIPLSYLTHEAWFAGLSFYVDQRVLIPRSPIAELIVAQFQPWIDPEKIASVLDLCTGSACIALACAYYLPTAMVVASDISPDALAVAQRNIEEYGFGERVKCVQSDLFSELKPRQFDLIISNPPYVGTEDMQTLPPEYRHEPLLGLEAGTDGLAVVERILRESLDYLTSEGTLIVEVGNSRHQLVEKYPDVPFVWLEFERGGEGVFLLTTANLAAHHHCFKVVG